MRPLSLATFGELEAAGIPLSSLSGKGATEKWAQLFAHLAGRHEPDAAQELLADLLKDPVAFRRFQQRILDSLQASDDVKRDTPQKKRHTVKNPLEHMKRSKDDMREEESETEESLDMTHLLMLSRLSGISLNDLSRMTFRGLHQLQQWLKDHPPDPPMQSLLGAMG